MPIGFEVELDMRKDEQVWGRPGMGDEQPVRPWIEGLEIKMIKLLFHAGGERVFLTRTYGTQTAGKGNILDEDNPMSRWRDDYLIGNVSQQICQ